MQRRLLRPSFLVACCGLLSACGGSSGAVGDTTEVLEGSRDEGEVREQCVTAGATIETQDVNGDGVNDIRRVSVGGVLRCEEFDFDSDGTPELTRFFAPDGRTPLREEHEFDVDGRMDQIVYYENGEMTRKELDTNFNNRVDTWIWCEGGRVSMAERDRRNDGEVDTWELYDAGMITQAAYDDNADGIPEKWEIFENGVLIEIRHDTDRDGEPDRGEEIPRSTAGIAEERVSCAILESYPDELESETSDGNGTVDPADPVEPPEPTGDPITDAVNQQEAIAAAEDAAAAQEVEETIDENSDDNASEDSQ